jgi:hypothetical protein
LLAFIAVIPVCALSGCGPSKKRGADGSTSEASDGGAGPNTDAGSGIDGGDTDGGATSAAPPAECPVQWADWEQVEILLPESSEEAMSDVDLEMEVMEWSATGFEVSAPTLPPTSLWLAATFPAPEGHATTGPAIGDSVIVRAAYCDWYAPDRTYVTVRDANGVLWWEGGNPICTSPTEHNHLATTSVQSGEPCALLSHPPSIDLWTPMSVEVTADTTTVVGEGDSTTVSIDGLDLVAAVLVAGTWEALYPCADGCAGWHASAYLARLE